MSNSISHFYRIPRGVLCVCVVTRAEFLIIVVIITLRTRTRTIVYRCTPDALVMSASGRIFPTPSKVRTAAGGVGRGVEGRWGCPLTDTAYISTRGWSRAVAFRA